MTNTRSDPELVTRRYDDGTVDLGSLLDLEPVGADAYRSTCTFIEQVDGRTGRMAPLFGGQVAAQALRAGGLTVDPARTPHSLHCYFLRRGDSRVPVDFRVEQDRDGRSFSARRVVATQDDKVIFTLSASFQVPIEHAQDLVGSAPRVEAPGDLPETRLPRLYSFVCRVPMQPYAGQASMRYPTRFWARVPEPLPDDRLIHACALTYLSDYSTAVLPSPDGRVPIASLDHALWLHQPVDMNGWTLSDYHPGVTGYGRGWYRGSIYDGSGNLVASVAQEALFRERRRDR